MCKGEGNSAAQQQRAAWDLVEPSPLDLPAGLQQRYLSDPRQHREPRSLARERSPGSNGRVPW